MRRFKPPRPAFFGLAALVVVLVLLGALGVATLRAPKAFRLSPSARPATSSAPVSASTTGLGAACGTRKAAPSTAGGLAGAWLVRPGSEAGYRAHEKFVVLESPHEAVARTQNVAGTVTITKDQPSSYRLESACFAVEVATLTSQDSVPGFNTADRDGNVRDMLSSHDHPFATFRTGRIDLPASAAAGSLAAFSVPGTFEVAGVARPATAILDGRLTGDQLQVVGKLPVNVEEHGIGVPSGADFVSVDPHITVEFSLLLTASRAG
jgi:hypothetical protein